MKGNKKVSPSLCVCGRLNVATKSKPISLTGIGFSQSILRLLLVLLVLPMAWVNAYGLASSYVKTVTAAPAEGLVYCNKSNSVTPSQSDYKRYYPGGSGTGSSNAGCYVDLGAAKSGVYIYCWAKPARGYEFNYWDGYEKGYLPYGDQSKSKLLDTGSWNGVNDQMVGTCGNGESTYKEHKAYFKPAASFTITYTPPIGGSYNVHYSYLKTQAKAGEEYEFITATEDYELTSSLEEATVVTSYAADEITLSTTATNFIGWYEGETKLSESKTYKYTAHDNVTIKAEFKEIGLGDVSGDVTVNATAKGTYGGKTVYIACPTLVGSWSASDFTISPKVNGEANDATNAYGSIEFGNITLNTTESRLEIPYEYNATDWGGISVDVTVTPAYGEAKQFTIACNAEEVVSYEACIEESGVRTYTGTLAAMMTQANSMNNKPTLKLMKPVTITSPLSFTKSFTFDVNGNVLTANCASAFSIDAAGVDVQIIDGSFTKIGEIHTSYSSSGNVNVVTFTKAAKLTMQGGTLSVENTGTGSAYGVDVQQGSIFYMTGGDLTVTATTGNAQGAYVATANDYATFNGGAIAVSAPTNAYAMWSAGQSNITNATISVETTTGANAYGVYVDGGTSTITTTDFAVSAKTMNAYGANVNAGRLNFNGGKLNVEAETSGVYGVHVASGATAMLQQNAKVTAEATGASGTNVVGINNLGTVSLKNISVTATSPTNNATAVNSATSAVSTTIEDGTYTANTETGYAYGLHHQYGALNVDGGTFKGIVKTSGTNAYGARAAADATIANATIYAETKGSANTAYGFVGGVAGKTITLTNCDITAKSNTNKAYAIYSRTGVTASGCTLTATTSGTDLAYGIYAEAGTNALTNCNATVSVNTISSYGAYHKSGSLSIIGGVYNVEAKQATATAAQNTMLYGLYNEAGMTTTVTGAAFNVTATNASYAQYVYGAYINGILNSTSTTYNVTACRYVYGLYGAGSSSNLVSTNNTIRVEATNTTTTNNNSSWSYGIYAKRNFTINGDKVDAIGQIKDVYAMFFDSSTSKGDVLDGKFSAQGNGTNGYGALNASATVGKVYLKGGVYKSAINLAKYAYTDYKVYNMDGSHPDYADGYRYTIATKNPSPYVCRIVGGAYYATLKEALQYTLDNSGNYTIVMMQPHTLPAGEYTLPANATLVIPYKFDQNAITVQGSNPANPDTRITAGLVENFLCLTMANGVHLNVNGKIGVGGELFCQQTNKSSYINGPYGRIHMEEGSLIQLNSGSFLYAWGMITGDGNIIVKNNAEVHEMFQVGDMKSASNLATYYNNNSEKFFPITQYGILNIEVPTTYYYNSRLIGALLCYYPGLGGVYYGEKKVKLVGTENALFEITTEDETTWVRKSYKNARQVWDINSSAKLGSISITISVSGMSSSFNSAQYILPITYNMDMHVLSGDFEITHNAELLPGSTIEIDKTASLTIKEGQKLYVFDKDQWPLSSSYDDAAINVHGNINVEGSLYTSNKGSETSKTDGANVYSNNADAGTIFFENAAPSSASSIDLITSIDANGKVKKTVTMDPAQLKNGIGASQAYTPTINTDEGHAFAYINNEWQKTYTEGCFEIKGEHTYAKPGDYVELKKQREQETVGYDDMFILDNHTYLSIDETRIFIHLPDAEGDCQWWEVTQVGTSDVYYCATNGIYYQYQYDEEFHEWYWREKVVTVTFYSDEEGTTPLKVITTNYMGIPDQAVIASNPTKATTTGYTYQFYGWKSSVDPYKTYPWTATLEKATTDMSYRPVFTATPRNYTVTFKNANNGADVPIETAYNTHPVCTPAPAKAATAQYTYYFQYWLASDQTTQYAIDDELPAVTGATYYTAVWSSVENRYIITWKDGETVLETDKHLVYGAQTSFDGTLPSKEPDDNFKYTFSGWRSSLTGQTYANGSTPTVAGETTYEAQFSTTPRYKVTFANYDGSELYHEFVTQGEHPVYNGLTPGRVRDLDGYFRFIGWKNSDGTDFAPNATLPAVTGKETYTAQYDYVTELYEITLNNIDGAGGTWKGKFGVGSTPFYDPNEDDVPDTPTKEGDARYSYPFTGWTPSLEPVSGETTYTAQFGQEINSYDITFANLDGNGASQTIKVEYGQTPVCPVTPTKDDGINSYAFTGWDKSIVTVVGEETYTATFSSTPTVRRFDITFDLDNGSPVTIVPVTYGTTPEWTGETPTKPATAQYTYTFAGWYPEFAPVTGEETYIAQYTQTLNSYTIRFVNYDGTELQSSELAYGVLPTYSGSVPKKPADLVNMKAYNFSGWSSAIATVTGAATYTAQYNEVDFVASVTTTSNETSYYGSWSSALSAANSSANCTLRLYQNVTAPVLTKIDQNMTIDLNGCTLSCTTSSTSDNRFIWVNKVALIIDDSKGGGKIYFEGTGNKNYNAVRVDGVGSLTVRGGTIQAHATNSNSSSAAYAVLLYNNSTTQGTTLNIYGGELIASHTQNARTASTVYFNGTNYVNVYGGKLKGKNSIFNNNNSANRVTLRGGYYSLDPGTTLTIPSGYEKWDVGASEPERAEGYVKKVVQVYTITFQNYNGTNLETPKKWEVGTTPAYSGATPTKPQDDQYTYAHSGWTPVIVPVEANATYTATFTGTYRDYTITWQDWDGTPLGTTQVPYDNATRPTHEAPTHADPNCSFVGWKAESNGIVYPADELPRVGENGLEATYIAQYECSYADLVVDSDNEPISSNTEATTTTVTVSGTLEVDPGVTLTTTNLILEASESGSGQILDGGTILATNVYYDLYLNTAARHWRAFGVPWAVDLNTNKLEEVDNNGIVIRTLNISHDYEIMYFDGAERAANGPSPACWKYLRHYEDTEHGQPVDVLTPGQGYMIAFGSSVQTVRFTKKNGAPIIFDGTVSVTAGQICGISNPMAYHTTISNMGAVVGQVHDGGEIGHDDYDIVDELDKKRFVVGKTVFIEPSATIPAVTITKANGSESPVAAPARRGMATDKQYLSLSDYYTVALTPEDGSQVAKVYVLPEEDKEDRYVAGHDLAKMGMSDRKAQIWVERYDAQLGLNTTAPMNGVAEFPIYVYAPKAGEYTIGLASQPDDDYTVYLLRDGVAIWDLSTSEYALTLGTGKDNSFALRLSARKSPEVATGVDEAIVDAQGETRKVLIDNKVFIIRGNQVYTIDGQLVK